MSGKLKRIGKLSSDDLVPSSEIAEAFDLQLTKKLFSALTDSEFGGHGMIEHLLSISSVIKPAIYMTVLLNDFHEHCRRLPDHIWRLLTMLHNEEYRLAFLDQLEALPESEQGAILSQVAREFLKVELKNPLMVH
jgi:hypothetical protein